MAITIWQYRVIAKSRSAAFTFFPLKSAFAAFFQQFGAVKRLRIARNRKAAPFQGCSNNRRQGKEKALGTHANGCVAFDVTAKKMAKENKGRLPPFWDLFIKTHRLKDSHEMCSQQAKEIEEKVLARAEELRARGEDPDYDAIFLELFGRVKKRKQVPGAGQATSLYFPFATSSTAGSASSGSSGLSTGQVDELLERRVQPLQQEIEELRELVKVLSQQVQESRRSE